MLTNLGSEARLISRTEQTQEMTGMIPDRNGKHLVNQWLQGILLTMRLRLLTPTGLFDLPSQSLNCHLYFHAIPPLFHDGQ